VGAATLATCRAALTATLLPHPGNPGERRGMLERPGGTVKETVQTRRLLHTSATELHLGYHEVLNR
jgi:hypothetical protein